MQALVWSRLLRDEIHEEPREAVRVVPHIVACKEYVSSLEFRKFFADEITTVVAPRAFPQRPMFSDKKAPHEQRRLCGAVGMQFSLPHGAHHRDAEAEHVSARLPYWILMPMTPSVNRLA